MAEHADSPNYHPLVRHVARALRKRCGIPPASKPKGKPAASIVVACSGGADSVALLRSLALLAERRTWSLRLIVGHVQHHLRGAEAEADAAFVSSLAGQLGLGFARRDVDLSQETGNTEAAARKRRYQALTDIALQRNAGYIATAHHADDQLETILMRLIRGSSVRGLRGIARRRRLRTPDGSPKLYAIRPMIDVEQDQVIAFLNQLDQPWREDASNRDTTRTRAYLRHEIVPRIKSLRADAAGKAVALGEQFNELHRLVQEQVEAVTGGQTLDTLERDRAAAMNTMVLTQILRRDLLHAGVPADKVPGHALLPVVEAVRDGVGGLRTFSFAGGVRIEVDADAVRVVRG